jgi:alkylation response protein AidB-like acyl-CoA dehydrogenase
MDFTLNAEQRAWQLKARQFADEEIAPISLARDRAADSRETFDWEIIRKGSRLGFRTCAVPREWGGHGLDFVTQAVISGELARGDSAIAKTFTQCWKWSMLMAEFCSPQQQERFLRPFMEDDDYLLGFGMTEPNAGCDNRIPSDDNPRAGWKLKAERKGDEWILNGEKCFIANASVARLFFVTARTNPEVTIVDGTTLFMVPCDTPGLRIGRVSNKSGWRFYQNGELIFENARVPDANRVGEVNRGYHARGGKASKFSDLEYASNAVGVCNAAVEMATRCARSRGARWLRDNQMMQLKLSEMQMMTETLRALVMRVAADNEDDAKDASRNNVLLLNLSCEAIQRVTRLNLDIHAGTGALTVAAKADKLVRDAIIWTHIAGDSVQRLKAVQNLLK